MPDIYPKSAVAAAAVALAVLTAPLAHAQSATASKPLEFFVTVEGGGLIVPDVGFDTGALGLTGDLGSGSSWQIGGEAGVLHRSGLRASAEVFYSRRDADEADLNFGGGNFTLPLDGNIGTTGIFGNIGYEYAGWADGNFRPFVEVGGGVIRVGMDGVQPSGGGFGSIDDSDWVLAGKVGGGFIVRATDSIDFTAAYHYIIAEDAELDFNTGGGQIPFSGDFDAHSVTAGLRFRF